MRKAGSEKTEQYIKRISGTICGRHVHGNKGQHSKKGGWGGGLAGGFLDQYLRAKKKCEDAKRKSTSRAFLADALNVLYTKSPTKGG